MSKKVIEEISSELELFRNKLSTFQTTVSYLQNAKEIAGGAIKAIEKTDQNFNLRIAELKHAYLKVVEYEKTITELVEKIGNVNFPERLDKIETSLNQALGDLGATKDVFVDELLKVTTEIHTVVDKIDEFIINYQGILDEQILGLKNEIEELRKYLKELDLEGIVTSAKTELIDTLNAKTETLLAKLANLDTALQTVLAQTDATHQLCSKEFPVLSEKIQQEANKAKENYLEPIKTNTKSIIGTLSKVDERITTAINEIEYIKKEISITHQLTKVILNDVDEVKANQLKNQKLIEIIKQQTSNLELRSDHISTKIDISQKAQRLQFMILMATVIVFGIVLILK